MSKHPRVIGHLTFGSITEAEQYFRNILDSVDDYVPLEGDAFRDVAALLQYHENAEQKIGSGIESLYVAPAPEHGTRCFQILRSDGTPDHFGYRKAIQGRTKPRVRFMQAARETVQQDVDGYKISHFRNNADQSGMALIPGYEEPYSIWAVQTDHADPTFRAIVDEFIAREGIDPATVEYDHIGRFGTAFQDPALAARFRDYHRSRAEYKLLPAPDNQKKACQARADRTRPAE